MREAVDKHSKDALNVVSNVFFVVSVTARGQDAVKVFLCFVLPHQLLHYLTNLYVRRVSHQIFRDVGLGHHKFFFDFRIKLFHGLSIAPFGRFHLLFVRN